MSWGSAGRASVYSECRPCARVSAQSHEGKKKKNHPRSIRAAVFRQSWSLHRWFAGVCVRVDCQVSISIRGRGHRLFSVPNSVTHTHTHSNMQSWAEAAGKPPPARWGYTNANVVSSPLCILSMQPWTQTPQIIREAQVVGEKKNIQCYRQC